MYNTVTATVPKNKAKWSHIIECKHDCSCLVLLCNTYTHACIHACLHLITVIVITNRNTCMSIFFICFKCYDYNNQINNSNKNLVVWIVRQQMLNKTFHSKLVVKRNTPHNTYNQSYKLAARNIITPSTSPICSIARLNVSLIFNPRLV
jgi:hypothetical protein